jgi:hypothetical protein
MHRVHRRRLTAEDRARSVLLELPFEVPEAASSVELRLGYDGTAGVVDLGCRGPAGFRGWSGAARRRVVVAADRSTPGYLTGAPEPGEWAVVLGLHRVPVEGLDVEVLIDSPATAPADPDPPAPPVPARRPRRRLPSLPGRTWLAADLHAHTIHSDGALSVPQLAARAVEAGLDVLAVTDHNTVSHHPELPGASGRYGVALLPGQEVTTDRGHANALGDVGWVDFRRHPSSWLEHVQAAGGLLSVNHPLAGDCAWEHVMAERPPLAEIWHWSWLDRSWAGPLAWWAAWGLATVPVGGSDFHTPAHGRPLGAPVTWLAVEDGGALADLPGAALAALAAGRTAITAGQDAPALLRVGDELVALGADGTTLLDAEGRRRTVHGDVVRMPAAPGPHRLETHRAEVVALCS